MLLDGVRATLDLDEDGADAIAMDDEVRGGVLFLFVWGIAGAAAFVKVIVGHVPAVAPWVLAPDMEGLGLTGQTHSPGKEVEW